MIRQTLSSEGWGFAPCRYGSSRLTFRGPPRPLDGRHIAFVGGSETVGRNVEEPFPMLIEQELGEVCVNFGLANASVEASLDDPLVGNACRDAVLTVVTVTGAANISNRLYSVHPRRNDRFLKPSASLRAVFPEVDFTEICFTRHLLMTLHATAPERFEVVREELRIAWGARMRTFLDRIGPRVVMVWFPSGPATGKEGPLGSDPLFVTEAMVAALRPYVRAVVAVPQGKPGENPAAAHMRAAAALTGILRAELPMTGSVRASA